MPRNVRNFWIELTVDGSATRVETGPRSKDGGFELTILMRDRGGISRAMELRGYAKSDGSITLVAQAIGQPEVTVKTQR